MRKSGRPSQPILHAEMIVDTALKLIDDEGMEGFSIQKLARILKVNPASFYHHFKNKDEILDAVRRKIVLSSRSPRAKDPDCWEDALLTMARSYRNAMVKHPNATLLVSNHNPRRHNHNNYERCLQNLQDAGYDLSDSLLLMLTIEVFAFGSAVLEFTNGRKIDFGDVNEDSHPLLHAAAKSETFDIKKNFSRMCQLILS